MIEVKVSEISISELGFAVFLKPLDNILTNMVPIFIGKTELQAIHLAIEGAEPPRPMTHDLFISSLDQFSIRVAQVNITGIHENTFYGELELVQSSIVITIDARPSDCIALALRHNAPIYIDESVYDEAGISVEFDEEGIISSNPSDASENKEDYKSQAEVLQGRLDAAVKNENFEEAAILRDQINSLQNEN